MALTLIKEDGTGKVDANSYATAAVILRMVENGVLALDAKISTYLSWYGTNQGTASDAWPLAVSDIYLGSRTDPYNWLGGMAEVLVFDDALNATDRSNVEGYLIAKYALT